MGRVGLTWSRADSRAVLGASCLSLCFTGPLAFLAWQQSSLLRNLPAAVGSLTLVMALYCVINTWLLLGKASLLGRLLCAAIASALITVAWSVGWMYCGDRLPDIGFRALLPTIALQRAIMLALLSALSRPLQTFVEGRLQLAQLRDSARGGWRFGIAELLLLVTYVGLAIKLVSILEDVDDGSRSRWTEEAEWNIVAWSVFELLLTLLACLPVIITTTTLSPRRFAARHGFWCVCLGALFTVPAMLLARGGLENAGLVLSVIAVFGLISGCVWWAVLATHTLRWTGESNTSPEPADAPNCGWGGAIVALSILLLPGVVAFFVNLPVLAVTGNIASARQVAKLGAASGDWFVPSRQTSFEKSEPANMLRVVGAPDAIARQIRAKAEHNALTKLYISTAALTDELCAEILRHQYEVLSLELANYDDSLKRLCETVSAARLRILRSQWDAGELKQLGEMRSVKSLELPAEFEFTAALAQQLEGLPLAQLDIRLPDHPGDLRRLRQCRRLRIADSVLGTDAMDQLPLLPNLKQLTLHQCELDGSAIERLPDLSRADVVFSDCRVVPVEHLSHLVRHGNVTWQGRRRTDEALMAVRLANLDQRPAGLQDKSTWAAERVLLEAASNSGSTARLETLDSPDGPRPSASVGLTVDGSFAVGEADQVEVLRRLASEITVGPNGAIHKLNLQAVPLVGLDLGTPTLSELRHLRIGAPGQTLGLVRQISSLPKLESLEIATSTVSSQAISLICQMKQLRRLQLPCSPALRCRQPERIPLMMAPQLKRAASASGPANQANRSAGSRLPPDMLAMLPSRPAPGLGVLPEPIIQPAILSELFSLTAAGKLWRGGCSTAVHQWNEPDPFFAIVELVHEPLSRDEIAMSGLLGEMDIVQLRALTELEYLLIPGYLLTETTCPTLAGLTKLRELNALFSYVREQHLQQLSRLPNLQTLSIGMAEPTAQMLQQLSSFPQLQELQIIIYTQSPEAGTYNRLARQLRAALPNCKLHLRLVAAE